MIPKIIHQTYTNPNKLGKEFLDNIDMLKKRNSDWKYKFYSGRDRIDFIEEHFSGNVLKSYLKIDNRYAACQADFFRYLVLFMHGGVYLDIKSTIIKPLNDVIDSKDRFIVSNWPSSIDGVSTAYWGILPELNYPEFPMFFIISEKKSLVLDKCINDVMANIQKYNAFKDGVGVKGTYKLTGPIVYSKAVNFFLNDGFIRLATMEELGIRYTFYSLNNPVVGSSQLLSQYKKNFNPLIKTGKINEIMCCIFFRIKILFTKIYQRVLSYTKNNKKLKNF